jgi:hypothetical protein
MGNIKNLILFGIGGILFLLFAVFAILTYFRARRTGKILLGERYTGRMKVCYGSEAKFAGCVYLFLGLLAFLIGAVIIFFFIYGLMNHRYV